MNGDNVPKKLKKKNQSVSTKLRTTSLLELGKARRGKEEGSIRSFVEGFRRKERFGFDREEIRIIGLLIPPSAVPLQIGNNGE